MTQLRLPVIALALSLSSNAWADIKIYNVDGGRARRRLLGSRIRSAIGASLDARRANRPAGLSGSVSYANRNRECQSQDLSDRFAALIARLRPFLRSAWHGSCS